jgi:hypothetical protein
MVWDIVLHGVEFAYMVWNGGRIGDMVWNGKKFAYMVWKDARMWRKVVRCRQK